MLKSNHGDGHYSYLQKQNVATFQSVINTEIGCVYPWFFFISMVFRRKFSMF